jgi:hypothetical protein
MADNNLWTMCNVVEEEQCCIGVGGCKCDSRDSCRLQKVLTAVLNKGLKMLDICVCLVPENLMDRMSMMMRVRGQFICDDLYYPV